MLFQPSTCVGGSARVLGCQPLQVGFRHGADCRGLKSQSAAVPARSCFGPLLRLPVVEELLTISVIVVVGKSNGGCPGSPLAIGEAQYPSPDGLVPSVAERNTRPDTGED